MKLLLDTHTFLWFIGGSPSLSQYACQEIENAENELYLSVASLWEMSIKVSLGRLRLDMSFAKLAKEQIQNNSITILQIGTEHLDHLKELPFHHKDPFDRLIIFQAYSEGMVILGRDKLFDAYGVRRIWNTE